MKIKCLIFVVLSVLLLSCSSKTNNNQPVLSVSIEPQKFFLEQLVGDKFSVNCVIKSGSNPETFDPTPSQLVALSKSKAYFAVGTLPSEKVIIEKVKANNPDLRFVNCSLGITIMGDGHNHGEFESSHNGGDPHIWSSPSTARIMVRNMYETLIDIDNANKDYYTENYNAVLRLIDTTNKEIREYLDIAVTRSFIIYHPALSYFAHEYGLKQYTIEYEGKSPTPVYLAKLIDKAKSEHVKIIFIQQEYDVKNAKTIATETDAKTYQINLLNYNWNEELINIAKTFSYE